MNKKIRILGKDLDLIFSQNLGKDSSKAGLYNGIDMIMKIDSTANRQRQEATLFHEILEAINYELELNMEHPLISKLETAIYAVLKDNKLINFNSLLPREIQD